jgi:hypothetical protein
MDVDRFGQDAAQVGDAGVGQPDDLLVALLQGPEDRDLGRRPEPGQRLVRFPAGPGLGGGPADRDRQLDGEAEGGRVPAGGGAGRPCLPGQHLDLLEGAGQDDGVIGRSHRRRQRGPELGLERDGRRRPLRLRPLAAQRGDVAL